MLSVLNFFFGALSVLNLAMFFVYVLKKIKCLIDDAM